MEKSLTEIVAKSIQLASQVTKAADEASSFKYECVEIKKQTERIAQILGWIAQQNIQYDRPILRIIAEVEQVLGKALSLVLKCGNANRLQFLGRSSGFRKISSALENCFGDVEWLRIAHESDHQISSIPPIARSDPNLAWTWFSIAGLHRSSPDTRRKAAKELLSLSYENDEMKKVIIEEGGVIPLLKLLKHGEMEEQELSARIICALGYDSESVEHLIDAGVFQVFAKILKDGPMKLQVEVASAVFKFADIHPKCQDICIQINMVRLLINHLSFEMIQEHVQNFTPINKATSVLAIVRASSHMSKGKAVGYDEDEDQKYSTNQQLTLPHPNESFKNKQLEDPNTKSDMKAMAAKALWQLVRGNTAICQIITESKALMCFTSLLAEAPKDVQYVSMMALTEITAIAEQDADLRRSVFKPSSPAWEAVIDVLYRNIQRDTNSGLLIPSVTAIGNLARTFRVTNVKIISSLVKLIDVSNTKVVLEVLNVLKKFCSRENHLHLDNCKAIINIGGLRRIVGLASMEESTLVSSSALVVLRCIATDVPGDKELVDVGLSSLLTYADIFFFEPDGCRSSCNLPY